MCKFLQACVINEPYRREGKIENVVSVGHTPPHHLIYFSDPANPKAWDYTRHDGPFGPWADDSTWIITTAILTFTIQTGKLHSKVNGIIVTCCSLVKNPIGRWVL